MRQFFKNIEGAIAFETAPPAGFSLVTGTEKQLLWRSKYEERREDGQRYYTETQADLYLAILDGTYTSTDVFEFESYTSELSGIINTGNWLTAQSFISTLPTSGIFDVSKKEEITLYINNYILDNY